MASLVVAIPAPGLEVDGVPTNADTLPTVTIVDQTISATVVTAADTTHTATGQYSYTYTGGTAGHVYLSTFTVVLDGVTYAPQVITYFSSSSGVPFPPPPITGSSDAASRISQQIADVIAVKEMALYALANINGVWAANIGGMGPSYTIASNDGSKTVSMTEFLNYLRNLITSFADLEKMLLQLLQDLTPFDIVSHVHIGGWSGGCW